jgi:hypothetical protein
MRVVNRRAGLAVTALTVAVLAAGCGVPVDGGPRDLDRPAPSDSAGVPPAESTGTAVERLYLVRDDVLVRVTRRVPAPRTPDGILADLLTGPTAAERADGLGSALTTTTVSGMTISRRRATVAVAGWTEPGARSDEILAYAQIVSTLTSAGAEVGTVSFTTGGRPLGVPRGDGSLSADPLTIADYADLIRS